MPDENTPFQLFINDMFNFDRLDLEVPRYCQLSLRVY
jgi:hypothetical protein